MAAARPAPSPSRAAGDSESPSVKKKVKKPRTPVQDAPAARLDDSKPPRKEAFVSEVPTIILSPNAATQQNSAEIEIVQSTLSVNSVSSIASSEIEHPASQSETRVDSHLHAPQPPSRSNSLKHSPRPRITSESEAPRERSLSNAATPHVRSPLSPEHEAQPTPVPPLSPRLLKRSSFVDDTSLPQPVQEVYDTHYENIYCRST